MRAILKLFKRSKIDPVEYKQPQEDYCSNINCLNEIANNSELFVYLDDNAVQYAKSYCFDCIIEGKIYEK